MFRKTVDGVVAQFRKSVADLRAIAEQQGVEVDRIGLKLVDLQFEQNAAVLEAERASRIAGNIEKLIG